MRGHPLRGRDRDGCPSRGKNFNELMFQIGIGERPHVRDLRAGSRSALRGHHRQGNDARLRSSGTRRLRSSPGTSRPGCERTRFRRRPARWPCRSSQPRRHRASEFDRGAVTVAAEPDGQDRPRTVTNASVDTVAPTLAREQKWRWVALGTATGCGIAVAAALLASHATTSVVAEPLPETPLASASATALSAPSAAVTLTTPVFTVGPSTDVPDAGTARAPEPRRRPKPSRGGTIRRRPERRSTSGISG